MKIKRQAEWCVVVGFLACHPTASPPAEDHDEATFPGLRLGPRTEGLEVRTADVLVLAPGEPFSMASHRWLVPELRCADALNEGLYLAGHTNEYDAAVHFDNCAFDRGLELIRESTNSARQAAARGETLEALTTIGRTLHTLQDFYARSSYIELAESRAGSMKIEPLRLFTVQGRESVAQLRRGFWLDGSPMQGMHLQSGVVDSSRPQLCSAPSLSRRELAKDDCRGYGASRSPLTRTARYNVAMELARDETLAYLRATVAEWDALRAECGAAIPFLTLPEKVCEP